MLAALLEGVRCTLVRGSMLYRRTATLADRKKLKEENKRALARAEVKRKAEVKRLRKARVQEAVLACGPGTAGDRGGEAGGSAAADPTG